MRSNEIGSQDQVLQAGRHSDVEVGSDGRTRWVGIPTPPPFSRDDFVLEATRAGVPREEAEVHADHLLL